MTLTLGRRALSVARPREPLDTLCDGCSSDCKPTSQYVYLISDLVSTAETGPWILRASRSGDGVVRWLPRPKRLGPAAIPDPEGPASPGSSPGAGTPSPPDLRPVQCDVRAEPRSATRSSGPSSAPPSTLERRNPRSSAMTPPPEYAALPRTRSSAHLTARVGRRSPEDLYQ